MIKIFVPVLPLKEIDPSSDTIMDGVFLKISNNVPPTLARLFSGVIVIPSILDLNGNLEVCTTTSSRFWLSPAKLISPKSIGPLISISSRTKSL